MAHINTIIPETLDPLQFAYRTNISTDDAISIALHTALSHLDKRNTYVRMLFIDYSAAFNTKTICIAHPPSAALCYYLCIAILITLPTCA
jgi:hypothetical protein